MNKKLNVALFCVIGLTGCNSADNATSDLFKEFEGMWSLQQETTSIQGQGETTNSDDISYMYLHADGTLDSFDYMGDSFDGGANCYDNTLNATKVQVDENGDYYFEDEGFTISLSAELTNNVLTLEISPEPEVITTLIYNSSDLTVSSFTPECS